MIDKGERESLSRPSCSLIKFAFHIQLGSKYQASINEIENSEQKLTDSAKSVDWSGDIDKTNKGNCQLSIFFRFFFWPSQRRKAGKKLCIDKLTQTADLI